MNTLTLDQLAAETERLKASFGGHFPTSIIELKAVPRMIAAFDSETEDLAEQIKGAELAEERAAKEEKRLLALIDKAEADIERLKCLLSEKEDGKTIMDWKKEAEEAVAAANEARLHAKEWSRELEAMRKRKGVQAGLFRHGPAVIRFLQSLARPAFHRTGKPDPEAVSLLSAIESTK